MRMDICLKGILEAVSAMLLAFVLYPAQSVAGAGPSEEAPAAPEEYPPDANVVQVDFAVKIDPPLVKKFSQYNSGLVTMYRYRRDIGKLAELAAESFRIDLSIGKRDSGWKEEIVTGSLDDLTYNFTEIDELSTMLNRIGVLPYWSWCYVPEPLQQKPGAWKEAPVSLAKWQEILRSFARHFREAGIRIGYHEVYNEPDLNMFATFPWDTYLQMYKYGVQGIRAGDPDAVVGGPAAAIVGYPHLSRFLDFIQEEQLPLDFFSFHSYGDAYLPKIKVVQDMLQKRPYYNTTEIHLNEFNPVLGRPGDTELVRRYVIGVDILDAIEALLEFSDLTQIHWAQFMDASSGSDVIGIVDYEGYERAAFNVFKIYARMPVDRVKVTGQEAVRAMASTDGHRASVVLWNRSDSDQTQSVELKGIPFSRGDMRVFRVDSAHSSYGDFVDGELVPEEEMSGVDTSGLSWTGTIPPKGVVYIEVEDGTGLSELTPVTVGKVVRKYHYFPDRTKHNYAVFSERTWIAYLGMRDEESAFSLVGVEAEALPAKVKVSFVVDGKVRRLDANSLLGVRVDYQVGGSYRKAVLFHDGLYDPVGEGQIPWGTRTAPDQAVQIPETAGEGIIDLAGYAPENWTGRVIISFLMRNTGANTRAKILIRQCD